MYFIINVYTKLDKVDHNPSLGMLLPRTLMYNWPIADYYLKSRKPLEDGHSKWVKEYYRHYPSDKMRFLARVRPGIICHSLFLTPFR